ncbi:DUF1707 and DUF4190 domain-containing protein [Nocardia sp. NPDC052566]|uniref:DUF1707 and DUF4190 domain-containing protein n=1 Tax=Nocardia sp. NPDC052566 TaxID=3364330 RepID=UPI0037C8BD23
MDPFTAAPNYRASDADREEVVDALKTHFQAGRLDVEELSTRIGMALSARTYGDLAEAMSELPPARFPDCPPVRDATQVIAAPPVLLPPHPQPAVFQPLYVLPQAPQPAHSSDALGILSVVFGALGICCGITSPLALTLGIIGIVREGKYPNPQRALPIVGTVLGGTGTLFLLAILNLMF